MKTKSVKFSPNTLYKDGEGRQKGIGWSQRRVSAEEEIESGRGKGHRRVLDEVDRGGGGSVVNVDRYPGCDHTLKIIIIQYKSHSAIAYSCF